MIERKRPAPAAEFKAVAVLTLVATLAAFASMSPARATAAPTPIPGGANQISGVSGTLSSTLFNGKMRIRKMQLRPSTAAEATASAGSSALTFVFLVSNGTSAPRAGNFSASMADADGVTINGHSVSVYSAYYSLQPGMPARATIYFIVPSGFTPVKILLTDGNGPAFRVNLKAADIPAAAPVQ
jgi:hypothetical protein